MNIMDKPSLQEVKEYFKNAKEVKNLFDGRLIEFTEVVFGYSPDTYMNKKKGTTLWCKERGYAEIISYKEPLYQLTAKEIVYGHDKPQYWKDTFKECFETEKQNGWYKCLLNENFMAFAENSKFIYGIDGYGNFIDMVNKPESAFGDSDVSATEKEVEEALVKEAIKRGFVKGVRFNAVSNNNDERHLNCIFDGCLNFDITRNALSCSTPEETWNDNQSNPYLFKNGVWAEILTPTYTIPEAEEKFGIKIDTGWTTISVKG